MNPLRILIADDNLLERETLEMLLLKTGRVEIVACCADGMEAAAVLAREKVDIVYSDIDMPQLSGLALLKSLRNPPVFVFISAFAEYAMESFDLDVVDYIMKPVLPERLMRSLNKAADHVNLKRQSALGIQDEPTVKEDHFFIRTSDGIIKLFYTDIAYIESIGNFSKIFTMRGKCHVILVNLKNLELQLPQNIFMRVHKQFIVNARNIQSIAQDDVVVGDEYTVPLSHNLREKVIERVVTAKVVSRKADRK